MQAILTCFFSQGRYQDRPIPNSCPVIRIIIHSTVAKVVERKREKRSNNLHKAV
jgi:hypothetical protein